MLVVQVVEIWWTKATRGAPRSNERVGLPRAFSIDSGPTEYLLQHYRIEEWAAFQPKILQSETKSLEPRTEGVLRISPEAGGYFSLGLTGTPYGGQPKRPAFQNAIRLAPGHYARLIVNARHTSYSGQYYSETVFNVACGKSMPPNRFLLGPPDYELDLKANLF